MVLMHAIAGAKPGDDHHGSQEWTPACYMLIYDVYCVSSWIISAGIDHAPRSHHLPPRLCCIMRPIDPHIPGL